MPYKVSTLLSSFFVQSRESIAFQGCCFIHDIPRRFSWPILKLPQSNPNTNKYFPSYFFVFHVINILKRLKNNSKLFLVLFRCSRGQKFHPTKQVTMFQPLNPDIVELFFWFGGTLGSASRAEFPVSLSNHVGFTPRLLYSSIRHSPESFTHLKTG